MSGHVICFDLEGPLSPQDNAYEVMGLFKDGHRIFEIISRYDDILTLEEREGYEPGDTLSLIMPFLIHHGITEDDIRQVSKTAKVVDGADYLMERLKSLGWTPYIISTSYQQHAHYIGEKVGIPPERIYCTKLPLDEFRKRQGGAGTSLVEELECELLEREMSEEEVKERLDRFYYQDLPGTPLGDMMDEVRVVGGQRKVDAALKIAEKTGTELSDLVVVGDSITDYKMLERIKVEGGVSVVFNGNIYAIPNANVGLATTDMRFLLVIIAACMSGGSSAALDAALKWEENQESFTNDPEKIPDELIPADVKAFLLKKSQQPGFFPPRFHYLMGCSDKKTEEVVRVHAESRRLVRGEAAKLG